MSDDETSPFLAIPSGDDPFARHVLPLFDRASHVAIAAASIHESARRLGPSVRRALERGARVEIVTGDGLEATQLEALAALFDWQCSSLLFASRPERSGSERSGSLEVRVVEAASLPGGARALPPEQWCVEGPRSAVALVGVSRAAAGTAIGWDRRIDGDRESEAYDRVAAAFLELWSSARPLDREWLRAHADRARARRAELGQSGQPSRSRSPSASSAR